MPNLGPNFSRKRILVYLSITVVMEVQKTEKLPSGNKEIEAGVESILFFIKDVVRDDRSNGEDPGMKIRTISPFPY